MKKFGIQIIATAVMCGLVFAVTGCSSTGNPLRCYDGPTRATNEVALLKVERDSFRAFVQRVDDKDINRGKTFIRNTTTEIELLPGTHTLETAYADKHGRHSVRNAKLSFECENGHEYELCVAPDFETRGTMWRKEIFGGRSGWTAWIIDTQTKKAVAGQARENIPDYEK